MLNCYYAHADQADQLQVRLQSLAQDVACLLVMALSITSESSYKVLGCVRDL